MKRTYVYIILLLVSTLLQNSNAFAVNKKDSLTHQLLIETIDSVKVKINIELAKYYHTRDVDSSLYYIDKAYEIVKIKNYDQLLPSIYMQYAQYYYYSNMLDKAKVKLNKALKLYEENQDFIGMANCYNNYGVIYEQKGELYRTLEYYQHALKMYKERDDSLRMAYGYNNIASVLNDLARYDEALENGLTSIKISQAIDNKAREAAAYNNIAMIYLNQNEHNKALLYAKKSYQLFEGLGNERGVLNVTENLVDVHIKMGNLTKAEEYLGRLRIAYEKTNYIIGLIEVYKKYAIASKKRKNIDKALEYWEKTLQMSEVISSKTDIARSNIEMGNIYLYKEQYNIAETLLETGLEQSMDLGLLESVAQAYLLLSELKYKCNKYKIASEYLMEYRQLFLKIREYSIERYMSEQVRKHEYDIAQNKLKAIKAENNIGNALLKKRQIYTYALIIVFIIPLLGILYILLQNRFKKRIKHLLTERLIEIEEQQQEMSALKEEMSLQIDKKEKQQAILEGNNAKLEKYTQILENANNPVIIADIDGVVEWVNEGFSKRYGMTMKMLKEKGMDRLLPFVDPKITAPKIEYCKKFKKIVVFISMYKKDESNTYWLQTTLMPIVNERGDLVNIAAFQIDFTKLKLNLEQAKQSSSKQEYNEIKSAFLANINHEIRTPLNAIIGFAALMKDSVPDADVDHRNALKNIIEQGEFLLEYTNDIIHLAKMPEELNIPSFFAVSLNEFANHSFPKFYEYFNGIDVKFRIKFSETIPKIVYIDKIRLRQLIVCLLGNALKNTLHGSVDLHFDYKKNSQEALIVSVIDSGKGIEKSKVENFNLAFSNYHDNPEFGMGFKIVNRILKSLQAQINIQSQQAVGTKIYITIPLRVKSDFVFIKESNEPISEDNRTVEEWEESCKKSNSILENINNLKVENLTEDTLVNLRDIVDIIQSDFMDDYMRIKKTSKITDIIEFSNKLKGFGEIHNLAPVVEIAEELNYAAMSFNISVIKGLLSIFPLTVEKLKQLTET